MKNSIRQILRISSLTLFFVAGLISVHQPLKAVEIPLDALQPVRVGFVDLQRVFDTYPEKSFAEGDLLKEIEKRRRELNRRQAEISALRAQTSADEAALSDARKGKEVLVPVNTVPEPEPAVAPLPSPSTGTVKSSTGTAAVEPYPTEDPLAGLPGHENPASLLNRNPTPAPAPLPGMNQKKESILDTLAGSSAPVLLDDQAKAALFNRLEANRRRLEKAVVDFKRFRTNAVGDMKQLQTEKTYGVMARIYAVLQTLARDENVTIVLDKAYVLYGEDTIDLSEKLISRLQQEEAL